MSIDSTTTTDIEPIAPAADSDDADLAAVERGAGLVEYALLVGLIAIVCIAAVTLLGGTTASQYSSIATGF